MKKPRWLVIHWGSRGGGPAFAKEMLAGMLANADVETFVSYSEYSDTATDVENMLPSRRRFTLKTYRSATGLVLGVPRLLISSLRLRRWITANQITTVYGPMFSLWQSVALPLWLPRGVTYISSVHDATEHPGDEHVAKRICYAIERRYSTATATYSSAVNTQFTRLHPAERTIALRHGATRSASTPRALPAPSVERQALFFGRVLDYKGIDIFVDAIVALRARGVNVRGSVWGSAPHPEQLEPLRARGGDAISWNVEWVDEAQMNDVFTTADIVLLPYKEASQSGVLAQAAGFGVPAVTTPVGGLIEQAQEYGNAVIATSVNAESVADAAFLLLTDHTEYASRSSAGIEAASSKFSWDAQAAELTRKAQAL